MQTKGAPKTNDKSKYFMSHLGNLSKTSFASLNYHGKGGGCCYCITLQEIINSRKQCIPFIWSVRSVKNVTLYIIYLYISGNLRLFRAEFGWG